MFAHQRIAHIPLNQVDHHPPMLPQTRRPQRQAKAGSSRSRVETYLGVAVFVVMAGLGGVLHSAISDFQRDGRPSISSTVGSAAIYVAAAD